MLIMLIQCYAFFVQSSTMTHRWLIDHSYSHCTRLIKKKIKKKCNRYCLYLLDTVYWSQSGHQLLQSVLIFGNKINFIPSRMSHRLRVIVNDSYYQKWYCYQAKLRSCSLFAHLCHFRSVIMHFSSVQLLAACENWKQEDAFSLDWNRISAKLRQNAK